MISSRPIHLKPARCRDVRGFFAETYSRKNYIEFGVNAEFVQDNHSLSHAVGTLRGLHQALPAAQGKLVRCGRGAGLTWQIIVAVQPWSVGRL